MTLAKLFNFLSISFYMYKNQDNYTRHLLNKYFLSTYPVPGSDLGSGGKRQTRWTGTLLLLQEQTDNKHFKLTGKSVRQFQEAFVCLSKFYYKFLHKSSYDTILLLTHYRYYPCQSRLRMWTKLEVLRYFQSGQTNALHRI